MRIAGKAGARGTDRGALSLLLAGVAEGEGLDRTAHAGLAVRPGRRTHAGRTGSGGLTIRWGRSCPAIPLCTAHKTSRPRFPSGADRLFPDVQGRTICLPLATIPPPRASWRALRPRARRPAPLPPCLCPAFRASCARSRGNAGRPRPPPPPPAVRRQQAYGVRIHPARAPLPRVAGPTAGWYAGASSGSPRRRGPPCPASPPPPPGTCPSPARP